MTTYEYEILSFPMDRKNSLVEIQAALSAKGQIRRAVVSIRFSKCTNIEHTAFLKCEPTKGADIGGIQ